MLYRCCTVNVESLVKTHRADWDRLNTLARRASGRVSRLSGDEIDELTTLYLLTSSHLSWLRTHHPRLALIDSLTSTVGMANGAIYGSRRAGVTSMVGFFSTTFPAALWYHRWRIVLAAVVLLGPAAAIGGWLANSDAAIDALTDETTRRAYVETDFEAYYSSAPAEQFSSEVFINNVQVAFLAFASGITLGIGTLVILVFNGANGGFAGGLFHNAGQGSLFWGLILPHGLLEISAIVIAGGAGLGLGWSIVAPGDVSRASSVAEEGQRSVVIVLGLIPAFAVAAIIEAFVTPSGLSTTARVGVGVMVFAGFWVWVLVFGRDAAARGHSGRLGET